MATFSENIKQEASQAFRDSVEEKLGLFGQALRARREAQEKEQEQAEKVELINTASQKLRMTSQALSSMEASFIQISKNMQLIAKAMGAEVTLQKETDDIQKKLADIAAKKQQLLNDANKRKQNDLSKLNKKINETFKQDKKDKSLFQKLLDALDSLDGRKRQRPGRPGRPGGGRPGAPGGGRPGAPGGGRPGAPGVPPASGPQGAPSGVPSGVPSGGAGIPIPTGGIPFPVPGLPKPTTGRLPAPTTGRLPAPTAGRVPTYTTPRLPGPLALPAPSGRPTQPPPQRLGLPPPRAPSSAASSVAERMAQRAGGVSDVRVKPAAGAGRITAGGVGRVVVGGAARLAGPAALAYGAYEASEYARESQLGQRLAAGQGKTAETAFRQQNIRYGAAISPESARAILDQPDSPGKRRDIEAFGGLQKLERLAAQARTPAVTATKQEIVGAAPGRQRPAAATTGTPSRRPAIGAQEHVFTGPMGPTTRPTPAATAQQPAAPSAQPQADRTNSPPPKPSTTTPGMVVLQTPVSKKAYVVAPEAAPYIKGFVDELEGVRGYKIKAIGGHRGGGNQMWHGHGYAIDINPTQNPFFTRDKKTGKPVVSFPGDGGPMGAVVDEKFKDTTGRYPFGYGLDDFPKDIVQLAGKWGLGWGGAWRNSMDSMHFSTAVNEGGKIHGTTKNTGREARQDIITNPFQLPSGSTPVPPVPQVPSNVVLSGEGTPIRIESGGFLTSGEPATTPTNKPSIGGTDVVRDDIPTQADARGSFQNASAFYKALFPYAEMASRKLGGKIPPSAILAQWAKETGGGKAISGRFNYAGIYNFGMFAESDYVYTEEKFTKEQLAAFLAKPGNKDRLLKIYTSDDEEFPYAAKKGKKIGKFYSRTGDAVTKAAAEGRQWVTILSPFAKFKNLKDFAEGYVRVLSNPRYKQVLEQTTAEGFARTAVASGYATANAATYGASVAELSRNIESERQTGFQGAPTVIVVNNNTGPAQAASTSRPPRRETMQGAGGYG